MILILTIRKTKINSLQSHIPSENSTTKITVGHMQSESLESTMKGELNVVETVVGLFAFGND